MRIVLLLLLLLLCVLEIVVSHPFEDRDVLAEQEVPHDVRTQIISMSKSGIHHNKITSHLRKFHFQDKDDADLRDIILAVHLEAGVDNLPQGMPQVHKKRRSKR